MFTKQKMWYDNENKVELWQVNTMSEQLPIYEARAVTVMDADTGFVIYENAQHQHMYPASITKIMTALLVIEEVPDLSQELVISESAVDLPYYAARMNLQPGDTMTVYEALYGLMLPSGNDIANALAEHVSGSVEAFVSQMNTRAEELGASNTRFINPCGLPGDNQHVTAFDMALIMREAIGHPVFNQVISSSHFNISPMDSMPEGQALINTNRMINPALEEYNSDIVGGKTGFTNAAQHTLVSYAQQGDRSLIISVLYTPRGVTFTDTAALMDYAFSLPMFRVLDADTQYWKVPVTQYIDGETTELATVTVMPSESFRLPLPQTMPTIRSELLMPPHLDAPVRSGDIVGYKHIYVGEQRLAEIGLISTETVLAPSLVLESASQVQTRTPLFQNSIEISPTLVMLPLSIVMVFGMLLALMRRRRVLLRRRRRIERAARHAQYVRALQME